MAHVTFVHGMANKPPADLMLNSGCGRLRATIRSRKSIRPPNAGLDLGTLGVSVDSVYWADVLYATPETDVSGYERRRRRTAVDRGRAGRRRQGCRSREGRDQRPVARGTLARRSRVRATARGAAAVRGRRSLPSRPSGGRRRGGRAHPAARFHQAPADGVCCCATFIITSSMSEFSPRPGASYRVRDELQRRFLEHVIAHADERPHIIVCHSMGTILTYDCVRNRPECPPIDGLITLGSPLGLDEVQDAVAPEGGRVDFPAREAQGAVDQHLRSARPRRRLRPALRQRLPARRRRGCRRHSRIELGRVAPQHRQVSGRPATARRAQAPAGRCAARGAAEARMHASRRCRARCRRARIGQRRHRAGSASRARGPSVPPQACRGRETRRSRRFASCDREELARLARRGRACGHARRRRGDARANRRSCLGPAGATPLSRVARPCRIGFGNGERTARRSAPARAGVDRGRRARRGRDDAARTPQIERTSSRRKACSGASKSSATSIRCSRRARASPAICASAIDAYLEAYDEDVPQARLARSQRARVCSSWASGRSVRHDRSADVPRIARAVVKRLQQDFDDDKAGYWELATAGEACLALDQPDAAELWYRRALDADDVEPFALASSIRQLKEVWGLNASEGVGKRLLPPLEAMLARIGKLALFTRGSRTASRCRRDAREDLRRHGLHQSREDSSRASSAAKPSAESRRRPATASAPASPFPVTRFRAAGRTTACSSRTITS